MDLADTITIADANTVIFRDNAPVGTIASSALRTMPGYEDDGHEQVGWNTISWARAVHINETIAATIKDESKPASKSTVPLMYAGLWQRLRNRELVLTGAISRLPGATGSGPGGAGAGAGAGGNDGRPPIPNIPPAPKLALCEFNATFVAQAAPFLAQFQREKPRFNFLIIVGNSKTGKSVFAEHAPGFRCPYVNEGGFNLGSFRRGQHDAIILSDVPKIGDIILKYKAVFQSNDHATTVGESATNWAAIKVNTHKTPIVVTLNKEADWAFIKTQPWIRENSLVIDCHDMPMYTDSGNGGACESQEQDAADATIARQTWAAFPLPAGDD